MEDSTKKKTEVNEAIEWLINNRDKILKDEWVKAENGRLVYWLLDQDDGTADSYETSQERFGITFKGEIIWGFSSGCSCWDGWTKDDYEFPVTYKEFIIRELPSFSKGWEREVLNQINSLKRR